MIQHRNDQMTLYKEQADQRAAFLQLEVKQKELEIREGPKESEPVKEKKVLKNLKSLKSQYLIEMF